MIECAAKFTPKDDVVYYGFDLWEDLSKEQYYSEFLFPKDIVKEVVAHQNIRSTGIEYHLIRGNSTKTLPTFFPEFPIDFVFIDGGHSTDTIQSDWNNIQRIIHKDSVVLFDDYCVGASWGCYQIIEKILDTERFNVHILPNRDKTAKGETIQIVKVQYDLQI